MSDGRSYKKWNRVFRVEKHERSGLFYAAGYRSGCQAYVLDKLGMVLERAEMQRRLDVWAKRNIALPVARKGCQWLYQGRLF